jgi:hypothetical protein
MNLTTTLLSIAAVSLFVGALILFKRRPCDCRENKLRDKKSWKVAQEICVIIFSFVVAILLALQAVPLG